MTMTRAIREAAERALRGAQRSNWAEAAAALLWLSTSSPTALGYALQVWIDAHVEHASAGIVDRVGAQASLKLWDVERGALVGADDEGLTPSLRWTLRIMDARAKHDGDAFAALCDELPDSDIERGKYIWTVLIACAHTIRDTPRGYAVRGGPPAMPRVN